jgi:hypothetical protein
MRRGMCQVSEHSQVLGKSALQSLNRRMLFRHAVVTRTLSSFMISASVLACVNGRDASSAIITSYNEQSFGPKRCKLTHDPTVPLNVGSACRFM